MSDKDLAILPDDEPGSVGNQLNIESIIVQAISSGAGVEVMEKLLAMRKQLKDEFALQQFNLAMSRFQAECPVIKKTSNIKNSKAKGGGVRSWYAPLDKIDAQTKKLRSDCGFSHMITTEQNETSFTAICEVQHIDGYSKKTSFSVPIEKEAYMTDQQKIGSAQTFAKRYAFCNAFGIMTADKDDDGQSGTNSNLSEAEKAFQYDFDNCKLWQLLLHPFFNDCRDVMKKAIPGMTEEAKEAVYNRKQKELDNSGKPFDDQDIPF